MTKRELLVTAIDFYLELMLFNEGDPYYEVTLADIDKCTKLLDTVSDLGVGALSLSDIED